MRIPFVRLRPHPVAVNRLGNRQANVLAVP
jgi:hypothetical protein